MFNPTTIDPKLLEEYVVTANSGKYGSWEEINAKFPELSGIDPRILEEYVVTANSGNYGSWEEINAKFPELFKKKNELAPPKTQPQQAQQAQQAQGTAQAAQAKPDTELPSGASSSASASPQGNMPQRTPVEDVYMGGSKESVAKQAQGLSSAITQAQAEKKVWEAENPETDSFKKAMSSLTPDIIDMDEGDAVEQLNKIFANEGFTFDETGFGDNIKVTAPNKQEQVFAIDMFTKKGDEQQLNDIKSFIANNRREFSIRGSEVSEEDYSKSVQSINQKLTAQDDDFVIPELKEMFGGYGFDVSTTALGDNVIVTAPNGNSIKVSVDNFKDKSDVKSANELKKFLQDNKPPIPKLTEKYNQYESRIRTEEDLKNVKSLYNQEVTNLRKMQNAAVSENAWIENEAKALEKVPQNQRSTEEYAKRIEEFNMRIDALAEEIKGITVKEKELERNAAQLDASIGRYTTMRSGQGDFFSGLLKKFGGGYDNINAGLVDLTMTISAYVAPQTLASESEKQLQFLDVLSSSGKEVPSEIKNELMQKRAKLDKYEAELKKLPMDKQRGKVDEYEKLRVELSKGSDKFNKWVEKNLTEDEIDEISDKVDDYLLKTAKEGIIPSISNFYSSAITSATDEYTASGGVIKQGLYGLAGSIPAMMSGGTYSRALAFGLQGLSYTMEEMNSPEFKDVSEGEKYMVAVPIAIVSGALEEFGFRNVIGKSSIVSDIAVKAFGRVGQGASAKTFKEAVENEIQNRAARGVLTFTAAGLSEAETGGMQAAAEIGIKEVYNSVKGKDMFNTPETVGEFFEQVGDAALMEAIGGFTMGVPSSIATAISQNNYNGITDTDVQLFSTMAKDPTFKEAMAMRVKRAIVSGRMDEEQGVALLESYDKGAAAVNSMPDNLTPAAKRKAMSLLIEKSDLQKQVDGKDEALVKKQRERINEINDELSNLPETAPAEAAPAEAAPMEAAPITYEQLSQEAKDMLEDDRSYYQLIIDNAEQEGGLVPMEIEGKLDMLKSDPVSYLEDLISTTDNDLQKQQAEQALTKIKEEQDAIQKQTAGQVPVQPTARVGEEVEEGAPQAEPQVPAQKGLQDQEIELTQQINELEASLADETQQDITFGETTLPRAEAEAKLEQLTTEREAVQFESMLTEDKSAQFMLGGKKMPNNVTISDAIDEEGEIDYDAEEKVKSIAKKRGIGITRDREISFVARDENNNVIGGAFTSYDGDKYTFDIVIDKEYDGKGVGSELLNRVVNIPYDILEQNPDATIEIDVVSPVMQEMLKKRGFEVTRQVSDGRVIMQPKDKAQFMLESQQSQAKQDMIDEATRLMEQEEKNGFSEKAFDATNPEPTVKPIAIEIKENTRLADKVKRMGLKELIGKKINLVMADQLKVGDISIGRRILKRMGGPFFPLIDELFGKVAWASINKSSASSIVNGAIKSDYTVVYNMNPSAIDSNSAMRDTFIAMVRKMPKVERDAIISKIVNQIKGKKFGSKTEQVQNDIVKVKTLSDFEKMMSALDVDTKALIINMILPSKDVKAETEIGSALQEKGITIESIREINIEQFVADLPSGALTMVIEVQDKNGNKITEATKEEAIITPEQQKEEGLPSHDNYPIYIRGKAVAILSETVPFWNILKDSLNTINVKVAKIVKEKSGRAFTAKEARSAEMRSASMSANAVRKVSNIAATEYEKFVSLLSRAFPTVEVVANQKEFDKLINELGAKKLVTKDQNIYGAVYNGKVYLNPSLENYNTPIHEFGHIWLNVAKNVNPELYKKGLSLVSDSPYVQQIKDNKDYQRVIKNMMKEGASESEIDTYIREEALATAIGDRGESFVIAAQKKNFKEWLNKLYSVVRKLVGISKYTAEQLETITFDEFTKAVAVDLMSGNEIFTKLQVKEFSKQLQLSTGKKDPEAIVKQGRANGVSENAIRSVLSRRGFTAEQIDAAMAKPEAAGKTKVDETFAEGFDRLMKEIEGIITKSTYKRRSQEDILDNVVNYIIGSKLYENATDVQREQMIRDARKRFGKREKSAPKVETLLGGINSVDKITIAVRDLVANQIKSLARGAKDAKKAWMKASAILSDDIKDMVASGKISSKQAAAVIKRFAKVDMFNETSVDNFVNYMAKVFADAEYDEKIAGIKSKLKTAKKNIYTKLGISKNLVPLLDSMLAINPTLVPDSVFDTYVELVDMLSKREAVLSLQEVNTVTEKTEKILDAINKQESVAAETYQRYTAYDKKVIKDGEVDFAETVKKMVEDNSITEADAEILRKYKNRLIKREGKKKTEEEIAQERKQLFDALDNVSVTPEALPSRMERDAAAELIKLSKSDAVNGLDNGELNNLLKALDNIANGYFPHQAYLIATRLKGIKDSKVLAIAEIQAKPLPLSQLYARIKSIFIRGNKRGPIEEMIRRTAVKGIDQLFGDFKSQRIFDTLFRPVAVAYSAFTSNLQTVQAKLDNAFLNVMKSHNNNPREGMIASYKITAYMIQKEYESNKGSNQVNKAIDFINETIKRSLESNSPITTNEAEMLTEVKDWVESFTDADGNVDVDAMFDSLNDAERSAAETVREINDSLYEKAMYTASVIRGEKIKPINNYLHLHVIKDGDPEDNVVNEQQRKAFMNSRLPSSKADNLVERTGSVNPINFDIFSSAHRGAKFVLLDFHMTPAIRTARTALSETKNRLADEDTGIITNKKTRQINAAINNVFEEALENVLVDSFYINSLTDEIVNYLSKTGYRAVLAGVPRFIGELTSNTGFALIVDPESFAIGTRLGDISMSATGIDVMLNLKSSNVSRIYSSDPLSGKMVDTNTLSQVSGRRSSTSSSDVANKLQQIYNNSLKKYKNSVEFVADTLISTPDKLIMRAIWFGSFAKEFEKLTGVKPDFKKIAANDELYMAQYETEMNEATKLADDKSVVVGASDNPFMGILKGKVKPNQGVLTRAFNNFNNYMTRFLIYEFMTARQGIMAAIGNGYLTKRQGAAMVGAVMTRMTVYGLVTSILTQSMVSLFTGGGDEEETEQSMMQKFTQAMISGFTGLVLGRDFGQAMRMLINYGLEKGNEKYLTFLRNEEYDPYKHSIAFSPIAAESKKENPEIGYDDLIVMMSGPFSPALKTGLKLLKGGSKAVLEKEEEEKKKATTPWGKLTEAQKEMKKLQDKEKIAKEKQEELINKVAIPLDVLGNLGFIPVYKDVKKIVNEKVYGDLSRLKKEMDKEKAARKRQAELDKPPMELTMSEYKRLFPDQYEARYGKNSEYRLRKDREDYVDKLMDEQREKMVNDFFNYVPKKEKQKGLFETDPFKSGLFDDEKNEKKKKDENPLKGRSF